jgi:O-antigen ligase
MWAKDAWRRAEGNAWLKGTVIALFLAAEAFIGLAGWGIVPLPLPPTVLMLAPVSVLLVLLFLLRLELGIALVVASFVAPLTVFSFGSFSFGPMPFLVILLFGLYLARGLVKERKLQFGAPGALPLLLLVGVSLASVAFAYVVQDPHLPKGRDWVLGHWWIGYQAMGIFLFAYTWMVYVVTANGLRSRTWLWAVYACAVAVCTYVVVAPLPEYLASLKGLAQVFTPDGRLQESASGSAAMLLALLTLAVLLYVRRPALRLALGGLFAAAVLNLAVSYYLNTWLGFLAGAAVITVKRSRKTFVLFGLSLLTVAVLAADLLLLIQEQRFSTPGVGDLRRLDIWANCIMVWLKSPVVGVGNANLASYFLAYGTGRVSARVALLGLAHPHNTYLGILAENGLLGLGCVVWLVLAFAGSLWRSVDEVTDDSLQGLAVGCLAVFVAGATTAMFASGLLPIYSEGGAGGSNMNGMAFTWILCGLGIAAARVGRCTSA